MRIIDIHHPHRLGKPQCRAAIDAVAPALAARFGLHDVAWQGDTLHFATHGVRGWIAVSDADAHVRIELGLLASLLAPTIEAEIQRHLADRLG